MQIFIPISVGNPLFTRDTTENLIIRAEELSDDVIIVVCDSLRILTNRLRSDYTQEESEQKANQAANDTVLMIENVKYNKAQTRIVRSSSFLSVSEFVNIESDVRSLTISNDLLLTYISNVVLEYMRMLQIDTSVKNIILETEYVLHETAISIYCTSILGYTHELYKDGGNGFVDYLSVWCKENNEYCNGIEKRKLLNWADINMKY